MKIYSLKSLSLTSALFVFIISSPSFAVGYNNATQWNQIGWKSQYNITINGTAQTIAPTGSGIKVGVIDTGATTGWVGNVAGSITLGACQLSGCTSSVDNNGHGTFVTSEMVSNLPSIGMKGLANGAKVLAIKALDASGFGTSTSVANSIIYAANNGAQVLNLSLGADSAAFYSSIASAVNYAAAKGVYIVFAGGNSSKAFAAGGNVTGFSDAAIQRMLLVGSVNAANTKSSFSNTAGTAGFISNTGKFYAYNGLWVTANGENLYGASNYYTPQYGYGYLAQMSGTSMSAPQAAAALALLESQWAILKTNGTAAKVLESTAKDLGAKGVDATYGTGLMNIEQAMNPYGTLTVMNAKKTNIALSSVTGSVILGGSFGATTNGKISTALQAVLSKYTTFDGFGRNYQVNLASLVTGATRSSSASNALTAPATKVSGAKFADGSSLSFGNSSSDAYDISRPSSASNNTNWFASFTDVSGSTMAAGAGFPAAASFAGALWGSENQVSDQIYQLGASSTLSNIAQGGTFLAYGTPLDKTTRVALSFSQTKSDDAFYGNSSSISSASSLNTGISKRITDKWSAGLTIGLMDQKNGLLDSTYSDGALNLGSNHNNISFGATSTYALSNKQDLVFDAAIIRTNGASMSDGLITSVSPIYSRSLGASYVQRDTMQEGDNLGLSLRAPLRVVSGSAAMLTTSVDEYGLPVTTTQNISMKPSGNEVALSFSYQAPVNEDGISWNMALEGRHDANNVAGANEASALIRAKLTF